MGRGQRVHRQTSSVDQTAAATAWHPYQVPLWRRSPLGHHRVLMRRRIGNDWEYRPMTDEEVANFAFILTS